MTPNQEQPGEHLTLTLTLEPQRGQDQEQPTLNIPQHGQDHEQPGEHLTMTLNP